MSEKGTHREGERTGMLLNDPNEKRKHVGGEKGKIGMRTDARQKS